MWIGREIEGQTDLGVKTLFVRYSPAIEIVQVLEERQIQRIWFCKEYLRGRSIEQLKSTFEILEEKFPGIKICIELQLSDYHQFASALRVYGTFYLKMGDNLSLLANGDHVCIGSAFTDESFRIGSGNKVSPDQYLKDEFIA